MRRHLLAAFVLVPAFALAIGASRAVLLLRPGGGANRRRANGARLRQHCSAKWMDANLRLDQVQVVGTAQSYKQRPDSALMGLIRMGGKKDAEALDFGHARARRPAGQRCAGAAFDVAYDPQGGAYKNPAGASMAMDLLPDDYIKAMAKPGFKVIHVLDVDYQSSCLALADCLKQVAAWSKAHPRHLPIVITLKTNDSKTPMPGATKPAGVRGSGAERAGRRNPRRFRAGPDHHPRPGAGQPCQPCARPCWRMPGPSWARRAAR